MSTSAHEAALRDPPRIHMPRESAWAAGANIALPENAARHVQVLRLQPGAALTVFDGTGGQWRAEVVHMGRRDVRIVLQTHEAAERELQTHVHLVLSLTANERMDAVIEKATELGAARITPVRAQRSVLRLDGERADKRLAHWRAVAASACEQCGRNRVPQIDAIEDATSVWRMHAPHSWLLCFAADAHGFAARWASRKPRELTLAIGPEGGWSPDEEAAARASGWLPTHLGARVLRADTAPLAALGLIALNETL